MLRLRVKCVHILVGKPEGKRTLGRPRRRRQNDIKIWSYNGFRLNFTVLFRLRNKDQLWAVVNTVMNLLIQCRAGIIVSTQLI
jgi:hypothetical protein